MIANAALKSLSSVRLASALGALLPANRVNRRSTDSAGTLYPGYGRPSLGKIFFHDSSTTRPGQEGSNLPIQVDVLERYRSLVILGSIQYDEEQIRVIMRLRRLQKELINYTPPAIPSRLLAKPDIVQGSTKTPGDAENPWWVFSEEETEFNPSKGKALVAVRSQSEELAALDTPKGLLLTGSPGSGKSFLVDLWYSSIPTRYKARKHYNQLVLEIYRAVWEETQRRMAAVHGSPAHDSEERPSWDSKVRNRWRKLVGREIFPIKWSEATGTPSTDQTMAFVVAKRLVLRHWLLVFDEIQLLDVSSASLLADVLSWYWRMGGVIVGTSNKVPRDLYLNGVQKDRLEPFVEALEARCPVINMGEEKDWRKIMSADGVNRSWYTPELKDVFEEVVNSISCISKPQQGSLSIFSRPVHVPWISGSTCKFTFSELCEQTLGPADYLTLASTFSTIIITDIPVLRLSEKNQARRFISLIDALYEARCKLICSAAAEPEDLFFPEALSNVDPSQIDLMMAEAVAETQDMYRPNVSKYDSADMEEAPVAPLKALSLDKLSIFSGEDEQFAFKRALSRLSEMTSISYNRSDCWTPLPVSERKWELSSSRAERLGSGSSVGATEQIPLKRPRAPQIGSNHMWGVREDWGVKSPWGKGVKVYEGSTSSRK